MIRHSAFPNVPASQPVGRMDGRRFMESYDDHTLERMAEGKAGETKRVIDMAKSILRVRGIERGGE